MNYHLNIGRFNNYIMSKFVPSRKASEILGIHPNTLRKLADANKIEFIWTPGGQRVYNTQKFIEKRVNIEEDERFNIIYCRVSSNKQKEDLQRQIKYVQDKYPDYEVISDVGSSLNYKRKGLCSLLERINKGEIGEVVVAHKDRLGRFGYEIIEKFIELNGGKLVVLNNREVSKEEEFSQDLIRIITFYTARYYGRRKYTSGYDGVDSSTSDGVGGKSETEEAIEELVRCLKICVQQDDSPNTEESKSEDPDDET
jgi:putative resolvase